MGGIFGSSVISRPKKLLKQKRRTSLELCLGWLPVLSLPSNASAALIPNCSPRRPNETDKKLYQFFMFSTWSKKGQSSTSSTTSLLLHFQKSWRQGGTGHTVEPPWLLVSCLQCCLFCSYLAFSPPPLYLGFRLVSFQTAGEEQTGTATGPKER